MHRISTTALSLFLASTLLLSSQTDAQTIRFAEPADRAPITIQVPQSPSVSQADGEGPVLELVEERWCPDIEDFCPLPPSYDFEMVPTGSSGPYLTALLRNVSETDTATNLSLQTDGDFLLYTDVNIHNMNDCPYGGTIETPGELPPGGLCRVRVKFAPTMPGPVTGTLTVTSDQGAELSQNLEGTGGDEHLLYGQSHDWQLNPGFFLLNNGTYTDFPERTSDLADDFYVEDPEGWLLSRIGLEVNHFQFEPNVDSIHVFILPDDEGTPDDVAVCSAPNSEVVYWEAPGDEGRAEIALSSPCELSMGHYWLRVQLFADSGEQNDNIYFWGLRTIHGSEDDPPGEPPIHLHPPVWRNPEDLDGAGCIDWTPIYPPACTLEDWWPFVVAYDAVFWLIGEGESTVADEVTPDALADVLSAPSPNPASGTSTFAIAVKHEQNVSVEVFDMMGRRVQTVYEGTLAGGMSETLTLDALALPAGVYVIRATGEDFSETQRVTVVK